VRSISIRNLICSERALYICAMSSTVQPKHASAYTDIEN
jgi:hypothetical protein